MKKIVLLNICHSLTSCEYFKSLKTFLQPIHADVIPKFPVMVSILHILNLLPQLRFRKAISTA